MSKEKTPKKSVKKKPLMTAKEKKMAKKIKKSDALSGFQLTTKNK